MKLYINNLNLDILPNIMKAFEEFSFKTETYVQVYSSDGMYKIDNSDITKLISNDIDIKIIENYYNDFSIIVDPSYFTTESAYQINTEHISIPIKKNIFKINKNSNIMLVIECEIKQDQNFFKKNNTENALVPTDIYFELPNNTDVNNILVKNEIIEFLSLLN